MAFTYTNRKGAIHYLHQTETKTRKVRYFFSTKLGEGAIEALPEGYAVQENVNGQVSLGRSKPRRITAEAEALVQSRLHRLQPSYRFEIKDKTITVFQPMSSAGDLLGGLAASRILPQVVADPSGLTAFLARRERYDPVMKFVLSEEDSRQFTVHRMTYRGEGGWSWPLDEGTLAELLARYLPHLGRDSFYELA